MQRGITVISLIKKSGALVGVLALAACASNVDVDAVKSMAVKENSAFGKALNAEYIDRATYEKGEEDWHSVDYFLDQAVMIAGGAVPEPQEVMARKIKGDVTDLEAARARLVTALNTGNARQATPTWCAKAQTYYEHWLEQREEGHQPDHIATAKANYEGAVIQCKGGAMASMPGPFMVYFGFDSDMIDATNEATVKKAAMAIKSFGAKDVVIYAHTDLSGDRNYNMALSGKRAKAVMKSLSAAGVPTGMMSTKVLGESDPSVNTGDGVKEARNRRAEITLR